MGRLTARTIETTKPRAKPFKLTDGDGLQLRVATDGTKTWLVRYMFDGKERQYRLPEPYGDGPGRIGLKDARDRAAEIRALARSGIDYQQRLADERAAAEQARSATQEAQAALERRLTVRKLFERWADMELAGRKDKGAETKRGIEKDVLSVIGDRYAEEVTRADVMLVLDTVKARGANRLANRLLSELRQMFGFALVREIVTADPTHRIAKRDVGGKDTERERVLSEAELRALPGALKAANLLKSTTHAVWIMASTGARIGEVTRTRLTDLDLTANTWTIPKEHAKNGREHVIYLSAFAKHHFEALLALSDNKTWVIPARRNEGPVCSKSITKQIEDRQLIHFKREAHTNRTAHADALVLAGGKWTPHDLRRTAGTLMGELGVDSDVIIKCLNQTEEHKVKRIYQRQVRLNDQIEAWRLLGERLDLLTRADAENVATLPARKSA
ncbi:Site-specific recombinase XerD [Burkholderia sp. D7]|nr:Site-specific recombinase XerD [Burkholderia sp. D7]